jgi:cytochrome d ubiquinol oxidase subunit II
VNPAGLEGAAYWLPLVAAAVIAVAVAMYVVMDGFDLGVGILFPFFPDESDRDQMMNSVAPFWDGNETWLVLGGTGLLVAFPLAYSIVAPALYLPLIVMLLALVLRGVAFEFRWVAKPRHRVWDLAFAVGSTVAAFSQGVMLGDLVTGIPIRDGRFSGGALDWLTPFDLMCGVGLVVGYAMLGSCWLVMKTAGGVEQTSRGHAKRLLLGLLAFIAIVSVWTPLLFDRIAHRWFAWPNLLYLAPVPALTLILVLTCWRGLVGKHASHAFYSAVGLFIISFVGLMVSTLPYLVPPSVTVWDAAAAPHSLAFSLFGMCVMLPVILGYTVFVYHTFRGKVRPGEGYH